MPDSRVAPERLESFLEVYLADYPDQVRITPSYARPTLQENCLSSHDAIVDQIHYDAKGREESCVLLVHRLGRAARGVWQSLQKARP